MSKSELKAYLENLVATGEITNETMATIMKGSFPEPQTKTVSKGTPVRLTSDLKRPWDETQSQRFAREAGYSS